MLLAPRSGDAIETDGRHLIHAGQLARLRADVAAVRARAVTMQLVRLGVEARQKSERSDRHGQNTFDTSMALDLLAEARLLHISRFFML